MSKASSKALLCAGMLIATGCGTPAHYSYADGRLSRTVISRVVRENAIPIGQAIAVINLGAVPAVSHHIVQVATAETLHVHRDHDLTVFVHRGHGILRIGAEQAVLREGDSVFIPRGVAHAFENRSTSPAVAVVSFSPAFDGKDTIPVER